MEVGFGRGLLSVMLNVEIARHSFSSRKFAFMVHKTKGIVIRVTRYGETSVIASIYTELFGIQSYIVNGVRTSSKKGSGQGNMFQPAAILDLVVYHNELKNIQRIKDFRWSHLYETLFF